MIVGGLPGVLLVVSFLLGVSSYLYGHRIPWSARWFVVSLVASAVLLSVSPYADLLAPFTLTYLTAYLGLTNAPKLFFVRQADYSYGVYLYSYVIQQALMQELPWARVWWINIALALPLSILFAAASWHFVEKPAQGLKRHVKALEAFVQRILGKAASPQAERPNPQRQTAPPAARPSSRPTGPHP